MPTTDSGPPHSAVRHPLFTRFYARQSVLADLQCGVRAHRDELVAGLSGRVVEVGAGNGLNFARYPGTVSEVVAVEPEPHMRKLAHEAARAAEATVKVVPGAAEALPVRDGSCDAAVLSFVMCSLRDVPAALAEVLRTLRPGGELRFLEHGLAEDRPGMARAQRVLDRTVWPLLFGGCHTARRPLALLGEAGFTDVAYRRLLVPERGPATPSSFHVLGSARRP